MLTGENFENASPRVQQALKEARKQAVVDYIKLRLTTIGEMLKKLGEKPQELSANEIESQTQAYIDEISQADASIREAAE